MGNKTPLEQQTHALYRFFGSGSTLLYIGITNELPRRLGDHHDEKEWWHGVSRVEVEHYPTRAAVLEAERRAIVAERPLYNEQHNRAGSAWRRSSVAVTTSSQLTPICMGCRKPIPSGGYGLIHIVDGEVNRVSNAWHEWRNGRPAGTAASLGELMDLPDRVAWMLHCHACNPHFDREQGYCDGCYAISVDECRTWASLVEWTAHLASKSWIKHTNWFAFTRSIAVGEAHAAMTATGPQAVN